MHSHSWITILAGGDGRRLASITCGADGRTVPKQFWSFSGGGSTFAHALDRALALAPVDRVIVLVQERHRDWWEPEVARAPGIHVVSQQGNRGTGVALLEALRFALGIDRDPHLLVLPSDHEVEDEPLWCEALRRIEAGAREWPDHMILLAAEAQDDPDYGWIVPGSVSDDGTLKVRAFHEKPPHRLAAALARQGALCSTFTFAGSGRALLELFHRHARPVLDGFRARSDGAGSFPRVRSSFATPFACDFSRDILEHGIDDIRVVPLPPCGWTDLGTPDRVARWRTREPAGRRDRASFLMPADDEGNRHAFL